MLRVFVFGISVGLLLPACATQANQAAIIRSQAAREFSCPENQVQTANLEDWVFNATGCGREAIYVCPYTSEPGQSPIERASFDLSCPAEQLKMTYLGNRSIGVEGCGKKGSYAWVGQAWVGNSAQ